jgi:nucleoid-associated protein YgaU
MTTLTLLPPAGPSHRPVTRVVRVGDGPHRALAPRVRSCDRSFPPDLHGSRLTPRGRAVAAVAWLLLAVVAVAPIIRTASGETDRPPATTTIEVELGDTLWALAGEIDSAADPRTVVDSIIALNGLRSGADIHPGDILVVPARRG